MMITLAGLLQYILLQAPCSQMTYVAGLSVHTVLFPFKNCSVAQKNMSRVFSVCFLSKYWNIFHRFTHTQNNVIAAHALQQPTSLFPDCFPTFSASFDLQSQNDNIFLIRGNRSLMQDHNNIPRRLKRERDGLFFYVTFRFPTEKNLTRVVGLHV